MRDLGRRRCGIVSFTVAGIEARALRQELRRQAINVWSSDAASTRIGMERRGIDALVRASVHYYNTEEELDVLCRAIREQAAPARI